MVQWLRLHASNTGGASSIPGGGWGTDSTCLRAQPKDYKKQKKFNKKTNKIRSRRPAKTWVSSGRCPEATEIGRGRRPGRVDRQSANHVASSGAKDHLASTT